MKNVERVIAIFFALMFGAMLVIAHLQQNTIEKYGVLCDKLSAEKQEVTEHFLSMQTEHFLSMQTELLRLRGQYNELESEYFSVCQENAKLLEALQVLTEEYYDYRMGYIFDTAHKYTYEEVVMIALVAQCEAGAPKYSPSAFRYVVSTILNRVESPQFPNTVYEVLTQKNQWGVVGSGRIYRTELELESLIETYEVLLFGTDLPYYVCYAFEDDVNSAWLRSLPVYVSVDGTTFAYEERSAK